MYIYYSCYSFYLGFYSSIPIPILNLSFLKCHSKKMFWTLLFKISSVSLLCQPFTSLEYLSLHKIYVVYFYFWFVMPNNKVSCVKAGFLFSSVTSTSRAALDSQALNKYLLNESHWGHRQWRASDHVCFCCFLVAVGWH